MTIETKEDIQELKTIGKIVADTLKLMMKEAKDGWTLYGEKGNVAAQYEHTMIITKSGAIVLT